MMKQCSIAIGCLVQWYEVEIVGEYLQSVKNALKDIENKENVIVDLYFNMTTSLEKIDESKMNMTKIARRFSDMEKDLKRDKINLNVQTLGVICYMRWIPYIRLRITVESLMLNIAM